MRTTTSKEKILKKIRKARINETKNPFPDIDTESDIYHPNSDSLDVLFAKEFNKVSGQFVFCENTTKFIQNLQVLTGEKKWNHLFCWENELQDMLLKNNFRQCRIGKNLDKADAGIMLCEALVARTGSILISSKQKSGRSLAIFPETNIIVAYNEQLVYDIKDGLKFVTKKYGSKMPSMISLITGPSRTADIEKTLVLGAHGAKEVFVFLIDLPFTEE